MAKAQRVIHNLSDLAILKTEAATGLSEESSEGGFVVGTVIETDSIDTSEVEPSESIEIVDPVNELEVNEKVVAEIVEEIVKEISPVEGDAFYDPVTNRYGRVTIYEDSDFFTNRLEEGKFFKLNELVFDETYDAWVLTVPSWAFSMVDNYRNEIREISGSTAISQRVLFEMIEEAQKITDVEESNQFFLDTVNDYLSKLGYNEETGEFLPTEIELDDHLKTDTTENVEEDRSVIANEYSLEETDVEVEEEIENTDEFETGDFEVLEITEDSDWDNGFEVEVQAKPQQPKLTVVSNSTDFVEWSKEVTEAAGRPPAELRDIPDSDSPTITVVTGTTVATIQDGEATIVAEDGETFIQEVSLETPETLIAEIKRFMIPGSLSNSTPLERMTIKELRFHLQFLKNNYGGSSDAASILREIEADYERIINDPITKKRLALLEQKGIDFYKLAQKMSQIMGNDITIKGLRYQEYHQLLQYLTRTVSVVFNELTAAADYMGIGMPIEEMIPSMGSVPIIGGMPIDEKTAMYILRCLIKSLEHWNHVALTTDARLTEMNQQVELWQDQFKTVKERLDSEILNRETMLGSIRSKFTEHSEFFIHVVSGNGYIGLKDEDDVLGLANMEVVVDIREALFLSNKHAASRVIEALQEHPKFSQYTYAIRRVASIEV